MNLVALAAISVVVLAVLAVLSVVPWWVMLIPACLLVLLLVL